MYSIKITNTSETKEANYNNTTIEPLQEVYIVDKDRTLSKDKHLIEEKDVLVILYDASYDNVVNGQVLNLEVTKEQ